MGFLELATQNHPERKKAFFVYRQRDKVGYENRTAIWALYLPEFEFGFGFGYTLAAIKGGHPRPYRVTERPLLTPKTGFIC